MGYHIVCEQVAGGRRLRPREFGDEGVRSVVKLLAVMRRVWRASSCGWSGGPCVRRARAVTAALGGPHYLWITARVSTSVCTSLLIRPKLLMMVASLQLAIGGVSEQIGTLHARVVRMCEHGAVLVSRRTSFIWYLSVMLARPSSSSGLRFQHVKVVVALFLPSYLLCAPQTIHQ